MGFDNLLLDRDGAVAVLTINRPQVLNALNKQTFHELREVVSDLARDPAIRVVILTGAGEKAFCAGTDINELASQRPSDAAAHAARAQQLLDQIECMGKPVIAAVNGYALGGGCELAMACTLRVAADTARFGQPEINLGVMPGYAATQRLPRLVRGDIAIDVMVTARFMTANEALHSGLVNRVVPFAELMTESRKLASDLAGKAPVAVRAILSAVNHGRDLSPEQGQRFEATLFGVVASTSDSREGTTAFLEKRKATFTGR